MKKLLLCAAFAGFGLSNMNAQENVIKVNPLAVLGGTDLVSYERVLGEHTSGIISAAIGGFKLGDVKYSSFGAGLQYRYYFEEVLDGWYGGAIVSYQNGKTEIDNGIFGGSSNDDEFDFTSIGGGLKVGHQWVWDSGFSLDLNIGASYKSFDYDFTDDTSATTQDLFKASGTLPTFGFGVGYAW